MLKKIDYASGYMLKWFLFATFMGIGGGISAIILYKSIQNVTKVGNLFPIWLAPALGGFIVCLIYWFDRDAMGFGTNHYINSVNTREGKMKKRTLLTKLAATSITLGFKGSGGVEGPMVMIGGSLSNLFSSLPFLKKIINGEDRRILTVCGAAGAVGAILRSPLGGGIFVVEVLYKSSLHYNELFPAILSSTIGYAVFSMISDGNPLFNISDYIPNIANIPFFIASAICAGFISLLFMWVFEHSTKAFRRYKYIRKVRPFVGGVFAGLVFLFVPDVAGIGLNVIQDLISGSFLETKTIIFLIIGKILATSFSIGSDGSGGLVIPALFIGAACGSLTARLFSFSSAGLLSSLSIAGMSASLASIANVPVAASIIIIEMVGLRLGVPATIGSIIGYIIGHNKIIYDITSIDEPEFEFAKSFRKRDRRFE